MRLYAIVRGRVQGVGFRAATLRQGKGLGLSGWVCNLPDGSVEVLAEGPAGAVRALESFLRTGPPAAHVLGVDVSWESPRGDLSPFGIR